MNAKIKAAKMRKPISIFIAALFTLTLLNPQSNSWGADKPEKGALFVDFVPAGLWEANKQTSTGPGEDKAVVLTDRTNSQTYFVYIPKVQESKEELSYGGALNLKYFSGIAYDYLQRNLPGKNVSFSVNIPESAVSRSRYTPNKLRVSLKSAKDNKWVEFYQGDEWTKVKKAGKYDFEIKIPEKNVASPVDGETYSPEDTILVIVEYYLTEGNKNMPSVTFSISDFKIEGIDLNPRAVQWQLLVNGNAMRDSFLTDFPEYSTMLYSIGNSFELNYTKPAGNSEIRHPLTGALKDIFLTMPVYIPEELRRQKGTLDLTIKDAAGTVRSSVKNFDSCNVEGKVYLTVALDAFSVKKDIEELTDNASITLRIKTLAAHTSEMMPIVVEPLRVRKGELIPFDGKWRQRSGGGAAYKDIEIRPDRLPGDTGFSAAALGPGNYQLNTAVRMQGGIDWKSPYYRVEFTRDFEKAPIDLDNMHLEVLISPMTDTTDFWQKPFRARLGLIDINGNIMFGPNVSLSEGLSNTAEVDVSVNNPIPKGLQTAGFDPKKIKSVIINLEGSHQPSAPQDLELAFINLYMSPREYSRPSNVKKIDFSRFTRDTSSWQITRLVKESGGYLVGINYPFPVVKVSRDLLAVPQIYPSVGMKVTDPQHFGFGSAITKSTVTEDFKVFAANDMSLVRLFTLGHLDGIFSWDEKGLDIKDFGKGIEDKVQEAAGMSVEKLAEFLNANEDTFFVKTNKGNIAGLEEHVMGDFTALLDILEQVEKETGKRVTVIMSLYDFLIGDGSSKEGPFRVYTVGEHPNVVTDPLIRVKAQALVWKLMKDLAKDPRFEKYVSVVEIMNEPDNATVLSTRKNFNDLLNFVGEGLYLTKDAIGPKVPVSVGFRSWPADLRFWAPISEGIDVMMIHYWESLESYDLKAPGMWPLGTSTAEIWKYFGTEPKGRMIGMGEIGPKEPMKQNIFTIEKARYDFCLIWSYSGHDSYDARNVIAAIKEYQDGNLLFGEIRKLPKDEIKKAFRYIITERAGFEKGTKDTNGKKEASFRSYLEGKLAAITDPALKKTLEEIIKVAELKGLNLGRKEVRFMLFEALAGKTPRLVEKISGKR